MNTVERCGGGGGPTRADAERDGMAARPLAGVDAAGTLVGERTVDAAVASVPEPVAGIFAVELTGTLLFTKRCSFASYTIVEPPPRAAFATALLLVVTVRATRAGVVAALA